MPADHAVAQRDERLLAVGVSGEWDWRSLHTPKLLASEVVFTVDERERVRERLLAHAREDARVVAAALVGSDADGGGDRWSDLDLTFGVAGPVEPVLEQWTRRLAREHDALHLFDLGVGSSLYRVFLLPGGLQVDLSFTPAEEFGALGPRFRLLFGAAVERARLPSPDARHLLGVGAHHAVRARVCLERGRVWQAAHWIDGVREQAIALACLRRGLEPAHGRGADRLPPDVLAGLEPALVGSLERDALGAALAAAIEALIREGAPADELVARLRELV
jgi:hypothetical protein